jgi:AraC-like DNA-binding protein/Ser/Thr protein kinase RdoA (MazF antagonist)
MQIPVIIQASLDYIERNLKTDVTAGELANMAGYSVYHYCRLFSSVMDSSVAYYIMKRRLDNALSEISSGRKAIDVVLEYGFETYAGFYKAFKRVYGCSPKKYVSIYHTHKPKIPEVAKKHMYTEKELQKILENWEIEKGLPIGGVRYMHDTRVADDVWIIGEDYLLRTAQTADARVSILKNMKIAKALAKQGFVSPSPVLTKVGCDYLDGIALFILTHKPKGSPLSKPERFGDNRADYGEKYGRSIGKLHKALKAVEKEVMPDEYNLLKSMTGWVVPKIRQLNVQWGMGLDEIFLTNFIDGFSALYDKLPKQLVHRNPCPDNILFENSAVTGFINFDLYESNLRLWDPIYCATGIMSETAEENYEKWLDVLAGILRGYDSEAKLTSEEKEAFYNVLLAETFLCLAYFSSIEEYHELAKINRKILEFIARKQDEINRIL